MLMPPKPVHMIDGVYCVLSRPANPPRCSVHQGLNGPVSMTPPSAFPGIAVARPATGIPTGIPVCPTARCRPRADDQHDATGGQGGSPTAASGVSAEQEQPQQQEPQQHDGGHHVPW